MTPTRMSWILMWHYWLPLWLLYSQQCLGLYEDQAGNIDWSKTNVGYPQNVLLTENDSPSWIVSTDKNVVASLSTKHGSIEWRHSLKEPVHHMKLIKDNLITVSGTAMCLIQAWHIPSGFVKWEYSTPALRDDDCAKGTDVMVTNDKHKVVIAIGQTLVAFSTKHHEEIWKQTIEGEEIKLANMNGNVVSVHVSDDKKKLFVSTVDLSSGALVNPVSFPYDGTQFSLIVNKHTDETFVSWYSAKSKVIQFVNLNTKKLEKITSKNDIIPLSNGDFVSSSGSSIEIYSLSKPENIIPAVFTNTNLESVVIANSKFASTILHHQSENEAIMKTADQMDTTMKVSINYNSLLSGKIQKAFFEVRNSRGLLLVLGQDGSISHFNIDLAAKSSKLKWAREEALTSIIDAKVVDLPEKHLWTQANDEMGETFQQTNAMSHLERFLKRTKAHYSHLKNYYFNPHEIPLFQAALESVGLKARSNLEEDSHPLLVKDDMGIRKLFIAATSHQTIYAVNTENGQVVWKALIQRVGQVTLKRVFLVRPVSVKMPALVAVVGHEQTLEGAETTFILYLDAFSGKKFEASQFKGEIAVPMKTELLFKIPVEEGLERTHPIVLFDSNLNGFVIPQTASLRELKGVEKHSHILTHNATHLLGYQLLAENEARATQTWQFPMPQGYHISKVSLKSEYDRTATLGRVMDDRSVRYKFLSKIISVAAVNEKEGTLSIFLLDAVKGTLLHQVMESGVNTDISPHLIQSENWIVYTYWKEKDDETGVRGHVATVLELFESEYPNERLESYSSNDYFYPVVESQAYQLPVSGSITSLGVTQTKHGISTKEVLIATSTGDIIGMSKRLIDPWRPEGKISGENVEWLVPYDPVLPVDPKQVMTYNLDMQGITTLLCFPSSLESTSVLVGYGLDMYSTRLTPSGTFDMLQEEFSKDMLVLTIVGLIVAIYISGLLVQRKQLKMKWE